MNKGEKVENDEIQMLGGIDIRVLGDKAYKYFGVLESDKIK